MEKKLYDVVDGVMRVNGAPVPESRQVRLTDAEALFDKAMGRIKVHQNKSQKKTTAKK